MTQCTFRRNRDRLGPPGLSGGGRLCNAASVPQPIQKGINLKPHAGFNLLIIQKRPFGH
jgi:hypothetical protein